MTKLSNGTIVTNLGATALNGQLTAQGYSIRHIETWHAEGDTFIVWDAPTISEADLPY